MGNLNQKTLDIAKPKVNPQFETSVESKEVPWDGFGWRAIKSTLDSSLGLPQYTHFGQEQLCEPLCIYGYRQVEPSPHWLLVALGRSELFDKQMVEPEISGWGYELTLRFEEIGSSDSNEPPLAAIELLNGIYTYAEEAGISLGHGHLLDLTSLIHGYHCKQAALVALKSDPTLGTILTPNGSVEFLQAFSITQAELEAIRDWNIEGVLELIQENLTGNLVCSQDRVCITEISAAFDQIEEKTFAEGSSAEYLFATGLMEWNWQSKTLSICRSQAEALARRLKGRLTFDRSFSAYFEGCVFEFQPGRESCLDADELCPVLQLTNEDCCELVDWLLSGCSKFECSGVEGFQILINSDQTCSC